MKQLIYRLIAMLIIILVIGALGYLTREVRSLDWLVENEIRTRDFVRDHQWQGWALGLGIYTVFSLVPGTSGKSVVWGWLFGFWPAVLIVDAGLTIAAVGAFLSARFLFRDLVVARFKELVTKLDHSLDQDAAYYLMMLRLAHMPYTFVNYGAGATSVPLRTFSWTTALGILPGTMVFVFVGTRIPTLGRLAEGGIWQLLDPLLIGILAAMLVFPILIRWSVKKYRDHAGVAPVLKLNEIESLPDWIPGE